MRHMFPAPLSFAHPFGRGLAASALIFDKTELEIDLDRFPSSLVALALSVTAYAMFKAPGACEPRRAGSTAPWRDALPRQRHRGPAPLGAGSGRAFARTRAWGAARIPDPSASTSARPCTTSC